MKGKNIYFTHKEMMCLLSVLKIWNDSTDEETYSLLLDFGLGGAWQKLFDKYTEGTNIKAARIYPDSDRFIVKLKEDMK